MLSLPVLLLMPHLNLVIDEAGINIEIVLLITAIRTDSMAVSIAKKQRLTYISYYRDLRDDFTQTAPSVSEGGD